VGYFVEAGAVDGFTNSACYVLEQLGWNGVCVEGNRRMLPALRKNRPGSLGSPESGHPALTDPWRAASPGERPAVIDVGHHGYRGAGVSRIEAISTSTVLIRCEHSSSRATIVVSHYPVGLVLF
jgi:hypothetical protein